MMKFSRKSRFRSSSYGGQPYYGQPVRRKVSSLWLILSLPLLVLALELLAQLFLGITGKRALIPEQSPQFLAYQPRFLTAQDQSIEGLDRQGQLKVRRDSRLGYQLLASQKNTFVDMNAQGFRAQGAIATPKPKDEIRIFLLGGSAAFGQGAISNGATLASLLENRLQQQVTKQKQAPGQFRPDWFPFYPPTRQKLLQMKAKIREGNYRVINAAVPGYSSGNILMQLNAQILPYQPDLVIFLGGYDDLMLPSSETQADIPKIDQLLANAPRHLQMTFSRGFGSAIANTGIATVISLLTGATQTPLNQTSLALNIDNRPLKFFLPENEAELQSRRDRFLANQKQILQVTTQAGIPLILALQPEISAFPPEKLSADEQKLRDRLGETYLKQTPKAYQTLINASQQLTKAHPQQVKGVNFYDPNRKIVSPFFTDAVNLTESANAQIAETLYQTLSQWERMQLIPENYHLKPDQK
jgi:hypothetical protein